MGKAFYEYGLENGGGIHVMSMHDQNKAADNNVYFPKEIFTGFAANKIDFVVEAVSRGCIADIVVISHINLLIAGWFIKKAKPSTKIILIAHGIEIWGKLKWSKRNMLSACDEILCVSQYTADKIKAFHNNKVSKITVLNNCIDPFLPLPVAGFSEPKLREKYAIAKEDIVLLTLSRLSGRDRYKGYDFVLQAMVTLIKKNKKVKYLLAGKETNSEKKYINALVSENGLLNNVILTGYISEEELREHFLMADIYVMPSTKEGFGIVFIEAMYYGLPVIAGNKDGSTDALLNGKLGLLIEPANAAAITEAVEKMILNKAAYKPNHALLMNHFGYDAYKRKLETVLNN